MDTKKTAIIILIILILGFGGYFIWKNYFSPVSNPSAPATSQSQISPEDARDNRRIKDIDRLSEAVESYMNDHDGQFPVANEVEKISDEESNVFKTLKAGNYLEKPLKDPAPNKYYYGYISHGYEYELTAALENKTSGKCEISGNLCLYKIRGTSEYLLEQYLLRYDYNK
ncbi:type II secretion system protein GspG [Candidatus Parcubacteria bacterium]|nr:type II secretion system protein GspG [Candidatus Parcubacteria bacterium]